MIKSTVSKKTATASIRIAHGVYVKTKGLFSDKVPLFFGKGSLFFAS